MPRRATYALRWQPSARTYALLRDGQPLEPAVRAETPAWWSWLADATSFAFESATGAACTARPETRQRGGVYWWAYRRTGGRMAKRYLGRAEDLSVTRLEEAAAALAALVTAAREDGPSPRNGETFAAAEDERASFPAVTRPWGPIAPAMPGMPAVPQPPARPPAPHAPPRPTPAPLLATKLHLPHAATPVIERPHVRQRLRQGLMVPLTVVTAPAGFGKTTALADWLRSERVPSAWVSLDAGDDEPISFWTYVTTAIERTWPGVAEFALSMLQAPHPPSAQAVARALLNAIASQSRAVVLALDDYHLITSDAIHDSIAALLAHPPDQLHLYLTARREPPLPLARLRVKGQVNEVHADHLRFRPDEIATFLADALDVRLEVEDVLALAERTDGWAAGVHLAGLSLRGHPAPSRFIVTFRGSHRHVVTYLGEEVLAAQPEDVREFLRYTAVLERFCAPLCDAVAGREDSHAMLERLERDNLFLVPLDDEGTWYRYYHLFAELLRHRLRQEDAALLPELHRRAARWLEADGALSEAIEHWLAVPDAGAAARAAEPAVRGMMHAGELPAVLSLLARLPEAAVAERPELCLAYAQSLFGRGQLDAAERWIGQAERALRNHPGGDAAGEGSREGDGLSQRALETGIANGRAQLASWRGEADTAERYSRAVLAAWQDVTAPERAGPLLTLGHAYRLRGNLQAAETAYDEASKLSFAGGNLFMATLALTQRGYTLILAGRRREAAALYRQAIAVAEARGGSASALAATAYAGLGDVLYQWNDLVGARQALERAAALGEQWEAVEDRAVALALLACTFQAEGDSAAAVTAMARARELVATGTHFPWLARHVACLEALLALRQGRLDAAERWAAGREYSAARYAAEQIKQVRHFEYLVFVRLLLARDESARAAEIAEIILRSEQAEEQLGMTVEALALRALARHAQDDLTGALEDLQRALALAQPEGYVRLFVDEGAPMRALLERVRATLPAGDESRRFIDVLLATTRGSPVRSPASAAPGALLEPLSARELEVLRLLGHGCSNAEIARRLVVAVSTVKTHSHHIFAKLHASDRLSAVLRARVLGLLDE